IWSECAHGSSSLRTLDGWNILDRYGRRGSCARRDLLINSRRLPDRDARHVHARAKHRGVGRDVERAPVGVAPGHVGAMVRDADTAEELSVGSDHVYAAGTGAVDVAFAVHLHAVGDSGLAPGELVKQALRAATSVGPH